MSFNFRVVFCAFLWLIILPFTTDAQLTPSERRGKEIYLRGTSSSGREITGRIGEIDVPASTVSCAGCHGLRGEGKTEGGVSAGNLTWPHLVKPYGHTAASVTTWVNIPVNAAISTDSPTFLASPCVSSERWAEASKPVRV